MFVSNRQMGAATEYRLFLHWLARLLALGIVGFASIAMASEEGGPSEVARFSDGNGSIPAAWEAMTFPKVERHTRYRQVWDDEAGSWVVEATSDAAAAGLIQRVTIDLAARPLLRWRWKVEGVLQAGDARSKRGDDYPARVYLIFDPDPDELSFFERAALRVARALYGDVPSRAISYIWASRLREGEVVDSAYAGAFAKLVAVESGAGKAGRWLTETRDVAADYRAMFGSDPARLVGVAIMSDTDDTRERVRAWYGDIEFLPREASGDGAGP